MNLYTGVKERRWIMHIVKLIERRFPKYGRNIVATLMFLSVSLLLLGLGLMFIQ